MSKMTCKNCGHNVEYHTLECTHMTATGKDIGLVAFICDCEKFEPKAETKFTPIYHQSNGGDYWSSVIKGGRHEP